MHRNAVILTLSILQSPALLAPAPIPDWCRALPRPEYKTIERVSISDPWFEVYKPAQGVFAIYEPHQAEETISYLIVGDKRALLLDTGMGISDLKKVIAQLTKLPIILLNSHTHNDHVGGQLGILQDLRHGYRLYAAECAGFPARCAGRNQARPNLWRAADGM